MQPNIYSDEQIKQYQQWMKEMDYGSGECRISEQEISDAMQKTGRALTKEELRGLLSQQKQKKSTTSYGGTGNELPNGREMFAIFDKRNRGFITKEDLRHAMMSFNVNANEEEVDRMMSAADTNGDGFISESEFLSVWKKSKGGFF